MSSPFASRLLSFTTVTCRQCACVAHEDSRYCDGCGAYLGLTLPQALARAAKRAIVGGSFGVISGAACTVVAAFLAIMAMHVTLTPTSLARIAQLCVLTGGMLGAAFDAMRDAVR